MSLQLNAGSTSLKTVEKLNSLSTAINDVPPAHKGSKSGEDQRGLGTLNQIGWLRAFKARSSPSKNLTPDYTDKITASLSGLSRMEKMSEIKEQEIFVNKEIADKSASIARVNMVQKPMTALMAQANQTPNAILKLLE
jgi:hypothetical protein